MRSSLPASTRSTEIRNQNTTESLKRAGGRWRSQPIQNKTLEVTLKKLPAICYERECEWINNMCERS